jgi:hypothetical protein
MKIARWLPPRAAGCLVLAAAVSGCGVGDPFHAPGTWQPMGANAMNLELQVAHPSDLAQGRGATYADGDTAAKAIDRMRQGKTKPLINWTTSSVSAGGSSGGGS